MGEIFSGMERKIGPSGMKRFKMTEMVHRPEIAGYFYRTIEEYNISAAISCSFDTAGLVRFVDQFIEPSAAGYRRLINPYLYASIQIVENLALAQKKMGLHEPIDFIFDNEAEKESLVPYWNWIRDSFKPDIRKLICNCPIFRKDEDFMPLQAADLWAWWVRKWFKDGNKDGVANLDLPWGAKRYIKRFHHHYDETFLRSMLEKSYRNQNRDRKHRSRKPLFCAMLIDALHAAFERLKRNLLRN
jgi:hypothetical protein